MYVDCRNCPLRQTSLFRPLEGDELEFVRSIKSDQIEYSARADVLRTDSEQQLVFTLFSGWAIRYLRVDNGARQILDVLLPGDLIALQSPLTGRVRHSVQSITPVSLCVLDATRFKAIFDDYPELSEALVATLLFEEHRADTRLLLLGRLRPTQRLAYLVLELHERLARRGLIEGDRFSLPLTYEHMADLIGVSRSQIGVSLSELRERRWADVANGQANILDRKAMATGARYNALPDPSVRALI